MALPLEELFRQNAWSTQRLIEACEALSTERLDTEAPGTVGTIRDTLRHIVIADQNYIRRLGGRPPEPVLTEDAAADLGVLKQLASETGAVLASMATAAEPGWRLQGVTEYGVEFDTEGIVFLLQAANHAAGHRQQVVSLLTSLGLAPEDLDEQIDAWSWGVATGALKTG